ncbi:MAG: 50S ribosomal protein L16 [Candidatus Bathyarchaeota archaeon]|nr:50S ribosomal protein L16 [Candidatus Bathyarchaeota archaeon]
MKARNFREIKGMSYTRRKYMRGVPGSKIVKFTMGNPTGEFDYTVELINLKDGQIRNNALEAARIAANRLLELKLGRENFKLRIIPFPHQVLREHKRINVAQADRFQEGMARAYGKPVGTAARVRRGSPILIAEVDKGGLEVAREALKRASDKFPVTSRIMVKHN